MVIWDRFKTKKIIVNGKEQLESSCEVWKHKWDTKWNILCVKIVAFISFSILIAFIINKILTTENEIIKENSLFLRNSHIQEQNPECAFLICNEYGQANACCFTCKQNYIDANSIDEIIGHHPAFEINQCDGKVLLRLEKCDFPRDTLVKNWQGSIAIAQLVINGNIRDIEDGAFNAAPLRQLQRLTLQFPEITKYRRKMFEGLVSLRWLEIQNSVVTTFEDDVLEYVASTIGTLQVTQSSLSYPDSIPKLTGVYMPNLLDIDLQFNLLWTIPYGAFHNAPKLVAIYLAGNQLDTLDEGSFKSNIGTVSIEGNDWICSCELYWLRKVKNLISVGKTKCLDGKVKRNFSSIFDMDCRDFKPTTPTSTSSISTSSTTSTTSSTPTISPETSSTISEEEVTDNSTTPTSTSSTTSTTSSTPSISPETSTTISEDEDTDSGLIIPDEEKICPKNLEQKLYTFTNNDNLVVTYPNANKSAKYFFFHSKNITNCNPINTAYGQIEGTFEPNTSYTFCELSQSQEIQCLSGRTLPLYEDQTWLSNQQKIPVILIFTFVNLLSILLSGLITYCCLKKHSKNKEEANYVRTPKSIYLTPNLHRPHFYATRLENEELRRAPFVPVREPRVTYVPVREASYFSPVSEHYIYAQQKPTLHRSVSDLSLRTVASYVTENQIPQIPSWRRRSRKERSPASKLFEEPPPLPPPRNRCEVIFHESGSQYC